MLECQEASLLVISQPDKASGRDLHLRPCPVAEYAKNQGLDLFQPDDINSVESVAKIQEFEPELLITSSYGGLLKRGLRRVPRCGAINLHPSLLPLYRGATPIQSALLNGDQITGVSIFRLNARMDAGPILCQQESPIAAEDDFGSLHHRLALLSAKLLQELLPSLQKGSAVSQAQDESAATYTRKLDKQDLILDWDKPASEVLNRIRAFSPQPGSRASLRGISIRILAAQSTDEPALGLPGSVADKVKNTGILVNCRDRCLLLTKMQTSGKRVMDAWAWQLGARIASGDSFIQPTSSQPSNPLREEI